MGAPGFESAELSGHVVVVGLHGIGLRVIEHLRAVDRPVVAIDDDADDRAVRQLDLWRVTHIRGNAARIEVLKLAGVEHAAAIICLERDELHTLEVALLSRDLQPRIRVIVRSANRAVGQAIASVTGSGSVLDAAALSAPAFVEALIGQREHDFDLAGQRFRVLELKAKANGTFREQFGDLVPIAVAAQSGDVTICPGRDETTHAGQPIAVLGTPFQLENRGLISPSSAVQNFPAVGARFSREAPPKTRTGSLRALWNILSFGADRALKTTLMLVVLVMVVGTIVIDIGYVDHGVHRMDLVDSIYTTVQTLVTVGYGDFPFGGQPTYLRIFDIVLMLGGTALIAIVFAQITDLLVSRRIAASFGSQRAGTMRNHIIVIGLGAVGVRVIEILRDSGKRVAVIDRDPNPRHVSRARALGVPLVVGDATDSDVLAAVNLSSAVGVAILTSNDLTNLETALAVRNGLGTGTSVPTVLRLFDRHLSGTVQKAFGFNNVRSTADLAAPWFVAAALGLAVESSLTVAGQTLMVGKLRIDERSGLAGLSMIELGGGIRVIAIEPADGSGLEHPPRRESTLTAGDAAYLIGPYEALLTVLARN